MFAYVFVGVCVKEQNVTTEELVEGVVFVVYVFCLIMSDVFSVETLGNIFWYSCYVATFFKNWFPSLKDKIDEMGNC